ncbi:hypothetical protein AHAS_Ahas09G0198600 [Arachis hypogaea]
MRHPIQQGRLSERGLKSRSCRREHSRREQSQIHRNRPEPSPRRRKKTLPPKSLTISDLSPAPMHGLQVRMAYEGVPSAYSEAAVGKAYPNGEAIACDQFEVSFQAIEFWIADRAILSVKNSFGGCVLRVGNTQLLYEILKKIQQKHAFLFWPFLADQCAKHQNGVSVRIIVLCIESVPYFICVSFSHVFLWSTTKHNPILFTVKRVKTV